MYASITYQKALNKEYIPSKKLLTNIWIAIFFMCIVLYLAIQSKSVF